MTTPRKTDAYPQWAKLWAAANLYLSGEKIDCISTSLKVSKASIYRELRVQGIPIRCYRAAEEDDDA